LSKPLMMRMVDLTPTATGYLTVMIFINAYYIIGQAMNTTVICGVFRSGGDSRFGFICDTIDMWVYFLLCLDEFVKMPFVYKHYKSYKWLQNITRDDV